MTAEIEQQRVAIMGERSWLEWRAVCHSHPREADLGPIAPWQAKETHEHWIDAKLDALEHDLTEHPKPRAPEPTFAELIAPHAEPDTEPLLPNTRLGHHVGLPNRVAVSG